MNLVALWNKNVSKAGLDDLFSLWFEYSCLDQMDTVEINAYHFCFEFYIQHIVCNFAYCMVFQVTPT